MYRRNGDHHHWHMRTQDYFVTDALSAVGVQQLLAAAAAASNNPGEC